MFDGWYVVWYDHYSYCINRREEKMRVGDIVVVNGDSRLLGEIMAIDDYDRATVKLAGSNVCILVHLFDLIVKEADCNE